MTENYLEHCCGDMANTLDVESRERILRYEPNIRKYFLILYENSKPTGLLKAVLYCPWCGIELPKFLNEEWGNALKEEYGLTWRDFWNEKGLWDESKIPSEFRTDEWWKKRSL